jgi:hypothetical protein
MPRTLKPPRGIFISSTVLYHPSMDPCVRDTLIQLLGLAWGDSFSRTPALSYHDLTVITGKKLRTLYGHIAALRDEHAALRLQSAGGGMYIIVFADWVRPEIKPPGLCKNLQSPVKEEESDSQNIDQNLLLPVNAFEERKGEKI